MDLALQGSFTFMFDFQTQLADYGHYLLFKTRDNVWDKSVDSYNPIWKVGTTAGQVLNKYVWKKVFVQAAWFIYVLIFFWEEVGFFTLYV